jgi:hypothetical protein
MVRGVVSHIFTSNAIDPDGAIDTITNKPIATIGFDQILVELRCGDAWSDSFAKRCWTGTHIKLVDNEYKAPETTEFFDGEKLWKVQGATWTEQNAGEADATTKSWRSSIDAALYQMTEEMTATWVRLFIVDSISATGASPPNQELVDKNAMLEAQKAKQHQTASPKDSKDMNKALAKYKIKQEAEAAARLIALLDLFSAVFPFFWRKQRRKTWP